LVGFTEGGIEMLKKLAAVVVALALMGGLAACNDPGSAEEKHNCESNGGYYHLTMTNDYECNWTTGANGY
jgi:uncharacterized lipoprotein YehR (DUF1307 family)